MSLQLICDHCSVPAEYLFTLGHASLHNGRRYDDSYSEGETHLHWECITPWWTATEKAREAAEEVPF